MGGEALVGSPELGTFIFACHSMRGPSAEFEQLLKYSHAYPYSPGVYPMQRHSNQRAHKLQSAQGEHLKHYARCRNMEYSVSLGATTLWSVTRPVWEA